jgi:uncharacterized membrane protein YqiK
MGLWRIDSRGRFRHRKGDGPRPALCYHGGAAFIVPVFQSYEFLDLTPTPIDIELEGALSQQNVALALILTIRLLPSSPHRMDVQCI